MNTSRITFYLLVVLIGLLPAMAGSDEPSRGSPPSVKPAPAALPTEQQATAAHPQPVPAPPAPTRNGTEPKVTSPQAPTRVAQRPSAAPTGPIPSLGSIWSDEAAIAPVVPSTGLPLAYSASRSNAALRVEDLMRGAAALRTQGDFAKAMELYNEALRIAPRYAEGYRQRALTLVKLGNRVQAQVDYDRFLALDPRAPDQVRDEITLFQQSGQGRIGESEAASYSYGAPIAADTVATNTLGGPPAVGLSSQRLAAMRFSWAQNAFQNKDYDNALDWAVNSNRDMPQARTRALMAQILFAKGEFVGAAAEARAAIAMGPVMDWRTLYNYYGYAMPRFSRQFHDLEEFVRQNPSSAEGHFLLGYEHLILGQADAGHAQLAIAAVIEPTDVAAKNLLAKDGVEIASSRRPVVRAETPAAGVEIASRPAPRANVLPPPTKVTPPPPLPGDTFGPAAPAAGTNRTEVIR